MGPKMQISTCLQTLLSIPLLASCSAGSPLASQDSDASGDNSTVTTSAALLEKKPAYDDGETGSQSNQKADEINWVSSEQCLAMIRKGTSPINKTLGGYWGNTANVVIGKWKLDSIDFFDSNDDGKDEISMVIADLKSPATESDLGNVYHENNDFVKFTHCYFETPSIILKGKGEQLANVEISGDFNIDVLEESDWDDPRLARMFIGKLKIEGIEKPIVLGYYEREY
jgi:hypothetical protein